MILDKLSQVLRETSLIFADLAPYLLLGFLLAGLLHVFVPKRSIRQALGGRGFKPIMKASLIGIPLPLCSCGVVPMAVSLRRQGASRGATLSFLISTPEIGVDSILITYGLFGPVMAILRPIAAFVTAMTCGLIQEWLPSPPEAPPAADESCAVCHNGGEGEHAHTAGEKGRRVFQYAFVEFFEDTAKWLVIGVVLAGIIATFVTPEFVKSHLGSPLVQMGLMLLIGIPIYTCASASTPIAAAFVAAGFTPGAALVFLLVGPATNAISVTLIAKFLGRRAATVYLLSIATVSVGLGLALDALVRAFGLEISVTSAELGEGALNLVHLAGAVVLAVLIVFSVVRHAVRRRGQIQEPLHG